MSNTTQPILELLADMGLRAFLVADNFTLFQKLKEAAKKDNKTLSCGFDNEGSFGKEIQDTYDLVDNQMEVLGGLIEGWVRGVLCDLVSELNEQSDEALGLWFGREGGIVSMDISFDDLDNYLDGFCAGFEQEALDTLAEWENCCDLILNTDDLVAALRQRIADQENNKEL